MPDLLSVVLCLTSILLAGLVVTVEMEFAQTARHPSDVVLLSVRHSDRIGASLASIVMVTSEIPDEVLVTRFDPVA